MKVKIHPIRFVNFVVDNFEMKFIGHEDTSIVDIKEHFGSYDIDMDYESEKKGAMIKTSLTLDINRTDAPLPGYSLRAACFCIFEFDKKSYMEKAERDHFVNYTSISITLTYLRGYIGAITASAPYGKYIFPLIDLKELVNEKNANRQPEIQEVISEAIGDQNG
jgi:hypothetical protein